jgi:hypothetical protein
MISKEISQTSIPNPNIYLTVTLFPFPHLFNNIYFYYLPVLIPPPESVILYISLPKGEKYATAYWWENNKIYPVVPASSDPGGEVWLEVSEPATQATLQASNGSGSRTLYSLMG